MPKHFETKFGWLTPVIGNRWSNFKPIVMYQEQHILPTALQHFDSLWLADHFYGFDAPTDPFMEAWTTLTWLAAKFPQVTLCHHVLGQGYRNPALTAKMAATLQVLSGNRFMLGIGAGWREDEYRAYGYEFPRPAVRFAQLEDLIHICRKMWTEDSPTYEGKHFSIDKAAAPPKPSVAPPICIGAYGEQIGLPLVGRLADVWNSSLHGDESRWIKKRDIVRASAERVGRDPSSIEISLTIERPLPTTSAEADRYVADLTRLQSLGVTHFVMDFGHPTSTEPVMRFVDEVIKKLKNH
jgi:alkanesulfonate monooxygenase SsuD/methylene tetrahydromethanopterin reductase-like flavin-dependent oxidoreductase (luciferase family)